MELYDIFNKFNSQEVITLTEEEELTILNALTQDDFLDCGSSRAVYMLDDSYAVKIGLSTEGQFQNRIEREHYEDNADGRDYFAYLYACGKFINVMELVTDCEYFEQDCDEEDLDDEDELKDIYHIINQVNYMTGYYGGDNGQLGVSEERGVWVVYDYGYSDRYDRNEIVGDMDYWSEHLDILELAIAGVEDDMEYTYGYLDELCRE